MPHPVRFLKGVGPKRAELFARLGIETVDDLLLHLPRRYEDRRTIRGIRDLKKGDTSIVRVEVIDTEFRSSRRGLRILKAFVRDGSGRGTLVWFNQDYLYDRLRPGTMITAWGEARFGPGGLEFHVKEYDLDPRGERVGLGRLVPIYPLTTGLRMNDVRKAIERAFSLLEEKDPLEGDIIPDGLPSRRAALELVHRPSTLDDPEKGRRRLAYDELLQIRLGVEEALASRKERTRRSTGGRDLVDRILDGLSFTPTASQAKVLDEVLADLAGPRPMQRLIQGDVGCGKTLIAALAAASVAGDGYDTAFMAPTEILAEQHHAAWRDHLAAAGIRSRLLTGSTPKAERKEIAEILDGGEPAVVFGTHALIERGVSFSKLGLVVIDEQQRFGVKQRSRLIRKGRETDLIVMTATPIPRTLAQTVYGDLDISTITEMPPGRAGVKTRLLSWKERGRMLKPIRETLASGGRIFFVYPLIEESEKADMKAAREQSERIAKAFPEHKTGLLTGREKKGMKESVMKAFRDGEIDILVATTVVEVGIDVPEAAMMVIEHAERFGLSTLHQLRGRIGRGERPGICVLTAGEDLTREARERLEIMVRTTDGFEIAGKDLELRGPGEILGDRQHGEAGIRIADLGRDMDLLEAAIASARRISSIGKGAEIMKRLSSVTRAET